MSNANTEVKYPSMMEYITPFYKGLIDGANVIDVARLIYRSSRIKKFLSHSTPLYMVLIFVNFMYGFWYHPYVLAQKVWYNRALIQIAWWGLWFIPSYIICKLMYYHQFMELWSTVYSKRGTQKDKKRKKSGNSESDMWRSISELIYGIILSTAYVIQLYFFDMIIPFKIPRIVYSVVCGSWMISWGVFEYRLIYEKKDLFQRIKYFERRWLYFLGFGLPTSVLYATVFDWYIGINVWYPIVMILSFRAVLSEPIKTPKPMETKLNNDEHDNEDDERIPRNPNSKPRKNYDHRRLRIFSMAEWIATSVVKWFIEQRNKYLKTE